MELEQDQPETVETEPAAPIEGGDGVEAEVEDASPSSEPRSRSEGDPGFDRRQRDDAVASQARFYQEQLETTRRELEALRASQRVDPREEQARLEAMDPEQRVLYHFDKQAQEFRSSAFVNEMRTAAQIDQLKFDGELDKAQRELGWSSAKRAQYAGEVEQFYNSLANQAMQAGTRLTVSRIDLLDHKIGREMRTNGAKAVKGAADKGKANIARQSSKMTPSSSNVTGKSSGMTKAQESMKRMLEAGVLEM